MERLRENTRRFRAMLTGAGFSPLEGEGAIIPIIVGATADAIRLSERLLDEGVFVTGFGFPVVPEGTARVRVQMSAALEQEHLERALAAFEKAGREAGIVAPNGRGRFRRDRDRAGPAGEVCARRLGEAGHEAHAGIMPAPQPGA